MDKQTQPQILFSVWTVILVFFLGMGFWAGPALASVRQMSEAPGQMLYQSREILKDNLGNSWQIVFFKRTKIEQLPEINLRLVGFPGTVEFAHPQKLKIKISPEKLINAADVFAEKSPAPHVGQYDFSGVINDLEANSFWELELPLTKNGVNLKIPYFLIQEWQTVANS